MSVSVLMPALSPTMTQGTLARWLVKQGDSVKSGDVIAEIETDKATMEVEALDDGVVASLAVAEGTQNVAVNAVIAVLVEDGETIEDALAAVEVTQAAVQTTSAPEDAVPLAPAAHAQTPPVQPSATTVPNQQAGRIFASPLARRIAADAGLDITRLSGTGPHGRIIRADVEEAISAGPAQQTASASPASAPQAEDRFVPHNAMRRVIAERLQQSKQTAPHFYLTIDCEIDNLLAARKALNEAAEDGVKISVNDMVVKAAAAALMAEPDVNGYFEAEGCRYFSTADICVAVAVDGGLVTPVLHQVENLGLAEISRKTADLAARARSGMLDPSEYAGGSFTISNLGMYGIREFAAVINPPQSAILAVGAGEQRPVVKNGELAVATVMSVTLSADHRIVDGALGAKWLQAFKRAIEQPVTMLL
ncbi:pyruvate dehydrogenase complex dihydrolipoamide acetyltransferase, long form [SAR116 cluster alpha proteobacterium HIMB100]|nr:pyruvate dehydrogenase complex dihydrolipoamide acetyltransferase, long form [SAR116 cluster alpha proteobacterium HIMB100]